MAYDNIVSRTDAAALIPEEVAREVIAGVREESAVLQLFRRVPVGRAQVRFPVLSALPTAYWVTGDTGLKQTTEANWANKFLNIEELAAIVPVPQNVVDDVDYDIWGEIRPLLQEAIAGALDSAVFFGTNAPASFPTNLNAAAAAAGNVVVEGSAVAAGGFQNDLDLAIETVEGDGFDYRGMFADRPIRGRLRRARNAQGDRLSGVNDQLTEYLGEQIVYGASGLWPSGASRPLAFPGDFSEFVVGVRQDISFTIATEGVIQDNTGAIVYNLFQQDMVAMRVTFRVGWQVSNRITRRQPTEANRYPVAVLRSA